MRTLWALLWWAFSTSCYAATTAPENATYNNATASSSSFVSSVSQRSASIASSSSSSSSGSSSLTTNPSTTPDVFSADSPIATVNFSSTAGGHPVSRAWPNTTIFASTNTSSTPRQDSTGTGPSYASACLSEHDAYYSSIYAYSYGSIPLYTSTVTNSYTTFLSVGPEHTECGSYIYNDGYFSTVTSIHTYTYTSIVYEPPTTYGAYPTEPICSVGPIDCASANREWEITMQKALSDSGGISTVDAPKCSTRTTVCNQCTIEGGEVQLLYFPVPTTVSRDMCASEPNGAVPTLPPIVVANGSAVPSTVIDGRTYRADKAYISFRELYGFYACGPSTGTVGARRSGDIIEVDSTDLSSLRFPNYGTQYRFNFADLNSPIPYSAYNGLERCFIQECQTLYYDNYKPVLAVPSQIRSLDPEWADCALEFNGLNDPPRALATAAQLIDVPATSNPPAPGNTGRPNQPPQTPVGPTTALPVNTGNPSPPNNPGAPNNPSPPSQSNQPGAPNQPPVAPGDAVVSGLFPGSNNPGPGGQNPPSSQPSPVAFVGGQPVFNNPFGPGVIVDGQTLTPGGPGATIGGTPVSVGSSGLMIGGSGGSGGTVIGLPNAATGARGSGAGGGAGGGAQPNGNIPIASVGGQTIFANPAGQVILPDGRVLSPGASPVSIDGTTISVGSSGLVIGGGGGNGIDGAVIPIPANGANSGPRAGSAVITAAGQRITSSGGSFVIAGTTFSSGGPAATIAGTVFSAGANGIQVIANGRTSVIPLPTDAPTLEGVVFTAADGHVVTATRPLGAGAGTLVVNGLTLSVGGPAGTVDGQVVSLGPNGLVIGGKTLPVSGVSAETTGGGGLGGKIASGIGITSQEESDGGGSDAPAATGTHTTKKGEGARSVPVLWIHCVLGAVVAGALVLL